MIVSLVCRFAADPETKTGKGGEFVVGRVAEDRYSNGENVADFYDVNFSGKTADFVKKYIHKGSLVFMSGEGHDRTYTDKTGKEMHRFNIYAETVKFVGGKKPADGTQYQAAAKPAEDAAAEQPETDDQLPF